MSDTTLWVSDSDLCDNCGMLLGYFGECPACGWEGVDWGDEEEDGYDDDEQVYCIGEYDQELAAEGANMSEPIDWKALHPWQRDQLIAEKIMGVTDCRCTGKLSYGGNNTLWKHHYYICQECGAKLTVTRDYYPDYYLEGCAVPDEHAKPIPSYSTDMGAAWLVLLKLIGSFERWNNTGPDDSPLDLFAVELLRHGYTYAGDEIYPAIAVFAIIKTWTPERICLAALSAIGIEVK